MMYTRSLAAVQFLLIGSHGFQSWTPPCKSYAMRVHAWKRYVSTKRSFAPSAAATAKIQQRWRPLSVRPSESVSDEILSDNEEAVGGRHVIFMSRYSVLRGKPLFALFDQLVARSCEGAGEPVPEVGGVRVALVPTASYGGADKVAARADAEADAARLVDDLQLQSCEIVELDSYDADPQGLRAKIASINPHAIWVTGGNTFYLRHYMRTSGFDNIVRDLCGPQGPRSAQTAATPARSKELDKGEAATESEDDRTTQVAPVQRAVLYVGQSAGAICGSASVDVAHFKGWDAPAVAPEPALRYGLKLGGPNVSIFAHFNAGQNHRELVATKAPTYGLATSDIVCLRDDQAWVWSQLPCSRSSQSSGANDSESSKELARMSEARTFVFGSDGSLSDVPMGFISPLPPLAAPSWDEVSSSMNEAFSGWLDPGAGVPCLGKDGKGGEPSVDPSRQLQRGDSEWFEEGSAVGGTPEQV